VLAAGEKLSAAEGGMPDWQPAPARDDRVVAIAIAADCASQGVAQSWPKRPCETFLAY
jgi:hypothetical protein